MTGKWKRRESTAEYEAEVAALFRPTDTSVAQIAKELDLTPPAVPVSRACARRSMLSPIRQQESDRHD